MKKEVIFYQSKRQLISTIIFLIIIIPLLIVLTIISFHMLTGKSLDIMLFIFITFLFATVFVIYILFKYIISLFTPSPFIVLTEQELILHPSTAREVKINWQDISGFRIEYIFLRKHIHIGLYDETKYCFKRNAIFRGYTILWKALSKDDQKRFIKEVNIRKNKYTNNINRLLKQEKAIREEKQKLNIYYFLRAYSIGLTISVGMWYIFDLFNHPFIYLIFFLFYPFAKIAYDTWYGFSVIYRLDKETRYIFMKSEVFIAPLFFWLVLYFFVPILSPIGIVYFVLYNIRNKSR